MAPKNKLKDNGVDVDEAIKKGNIFVSYPSIFLLLTVLVPGLILAHINWIHDHQFFWFVLVGLGLSIVYWAIAVTQWRIWAFSNVRNVHELQTKARDRSIIPKAGSFLEKMEYRSEQDKALLLKLQEKFEVKDVFIKPLNFPEVTTVYVSRPLLILYLIITLFVFVVLCVVIYKDGVDWLFMLMLFGTSYFLQDQLRKLIFNAPQIILSKNGIETPKHKLYKWSKIKDLEIKQRMSNNSNKFYLEYGTPSQFVSICLEDLEIGIDELREALKIYRHKK